MEGSIHRSTFATAPPAIVLFASGGISGAIAHSCTAPYDRAKLLLQLGSKETMAKVLRKVYVMDGATGYFRGNFVNCCRQFFSKGLLFGFNDYFKSQTQRLSEPSSSTSKTKSMFFSAFLSGSMAGVATQLITYPLDVIRVRYSGHLGNTRYNGFFVTLGHTLRDEGPSALYRGATPTIYGAVVYEGIKFGTFDLYLHLLNQLYDWGQTSPSVIAGTLTGISAVLLTHPNDTVRRRMQMQGLGGVPKLYRHTLHAYHTIFRMEGIRSFYNGLIPAVIGKVPSVAIQFTIYHGIKTGLNM